MHSLDWLRVPSGYTRGSLLDLSATIQQFSLSQFSVLTILFLAALNSPAFFHLPSNSKENCSMVVTVLAFEDLASFCLDYDVHGG